MRCDRGIAPIAPIPPCDRWADRLTPILVLCGAKGVRTGRVGRTPDDPSEPFGAEAAQFITQHVLQHDVTAEIENVDKTGGFIGSLYTENGDNVAVLLLENGLATLHGPSADQSRHVNQLYSAETRAKASLKNVRALERTGDRAGMGRGLGLAGRGLGAGHGLGESYWLARNRGPFVAAALVTDSGTRMANPFAFPNPNPDLNPTHPPTPPTRTPSRSGPTTTRSRSAPAVRPRPPRLRPPASDRTRRLSASA